MIVKESQLEQGRQSQDYPVFLNVEQRKQFLEEKTQRLLAEYHVFKKHDPKDFEHS